MGMKALIPSTNLSLLRGLHWAVAQAFRRAGFKWEERRTGDLKIGFWKMSLRGGNKRGGRGKTLPKRFVLIPGFGDTTLSWLGVLGLARPILSRSYDEVILIDLPGFQGFLSHEKCFGSMDLLIQSLADTLDSLKPHTIFGHSLGGWLSTHYAIETGMGNRPSGPARKGYQGPEELILFGPAGLFGNEQDKREWTEKFERAMEQGIEPLRRHVFGKEPIWFRLIAKQYSGFLCREDVIQFMRSVRDDHLVQERLNRIRARVWLVWGEQDTLALSRWAPDWLERLNRERDPSLPEAQGVIIKGAGHSPHIEKPAVTAAVLGQILLGKNPHPAGHRWWQPIGAGELVELG